MTIRGRKSASQYRLTCRCGYFQVGCHCGPPDNFIEHSHLSRVGKAGRARGISRDGRQFRDQAFGFADFRDARARVLASECHFGGLGMGRLSADSAHLVCRQEPCGQCKNGNLETPRSSHRRYRCEQADRDAHQRLCSLAPCLLNSRARARAPARSARLAARAPEGSSTKVNSILDGSLPS